MRIAIDLRSLQTGSLSGVENYVLNLTENILELDSKNSYKLFYNSFRNFPVHELHYINSKIVAAHYPNRLLNLSFKLLQRPRLEKIMGDFDCLFLPNFNLFAIAPKTKLIVTVHDLSPLILPQYYNLKQQLWHRFLNIKKILRRADYILAVSEYTKKDVIRLAGVEPDRVRVVYPGVNRVADSFLTEDKLRALRNKYGLPGSFLLFLSTIEPRKNLPSLLKAFEQLSEETDLVILGKLGWKYRQVIKEIKHSKKASHIRFLGYIEERDKPGIIKLSRAVVYPSFYEGFGFVPLEAFALGVPALASNITSIPEVCQDGALLFNPYSLDELVKALRDILNNENLQKDLIQRGRRVVEKFQWKTSAQQVVNLINGI